jgi:hypothetical protein
MKLKTLLLTAGATMLACGTANAAEIEATTEFLDNMNARLASQGYSFAISSMETLAGPDSNEMGLTVFSSVHGNKQLGHDFVPGDARRTWGNTNGANITWAYDTVDITADVSPAAQRAAITAGQEDWADVGCSTVSTDEVQAAGDIGFVQAFYGLGGDFDIKADITHATFIPGGILAPSTLGVTFTFIFTDGSGPTDIDNNGRLDTALREIWYNDGFAWDTEGAPGTIDIQTVALHEAGHAMSRAHYGNVAVNPQGKLLLTPRASMNAIYFGEFRELAGTDTGGHCSDWADWPNQ